MFQHLCDRHHILKDNSWMCILHQYHKTAGLNRAQREENAGKYIRQIYFIISRWRHPVDHVFSSGALVVMKECKIITLKYTGKAYMLYLLYSSAPEDIIL